MDVKLKSDQRRVAPVATAALERCQRHPALG
jgi:hypothetical protein